MGECNLVFTAVPVGPPYYLHGPCRAVARCTTHGMVDFEAFSELPGEQLCPIGKIERATDEALAKIAAAQRDMQEVGG